MTWPDVTWALVASLTTGVVASLLVLMLAPLTASSRDRRKDELVTRREFLNACASTTRAGYLFWSSIHDNGIPKDRALTDLLWGEFNEAYIAVRSFGPPESFEDTLDDFWDGLNELRVLQTLAGGAATPAKLSSEEVRARMEILDPRITESRERWEKTVVQVRQLSRKKFNKTRIAC